MREVSDALACIPLSHYPRNGFATVFGQAIKRSLRSGNFGSSDVTKFSAITGLREDLQKGGPQAGADFLKPYFIAVARVLMRAEEKG
jgi:hypothetical protein